MTLYMALVFGPMISFMLSAIMYSEMKSVIRRYNDGDSIAHDITSLTFSIILGLALVTIFSGG